MAQPYVGEIRMFAGNFPPNGWAFCNGAPVAISENETLFTLIGTTYGGDGQNTFNLPDLQSRVPLHFGTAPSGTTYQIGEAAGVEQVTLSTQQMPNHTHPMVASTQTGTQLAPAGNVTDQTSAGIFIYYEGSSDGNFNSAAVTATGGSQPHENCQPFLCINFIISLYGIFPTQT